MPEPRVTVAIPVGPAPHHREWLPKAVASALNQTVPVEIVLVDDMAERATVGPESMMLPGWEYLTGEGDALVSGDDFVMVMHNFWLLGVAASFNVGVAVAPTELVFMLGSDDWLEPDCIERCLEVYDARPEDRRGLGYYWVGVRYTDDRRDPVQHLPCNAAMVSKTLWRATGGFPPETGVGAPDAALISMMMTRPELFDLVEVPGGPTRRPLYHHRIHPGQDTAGRQPYLAAIHNVRGVLTESWGPPRWGRFA